MRQHLRPRKPNARRQQAWRFLAGLWLFLPALAAAAVALPNDDTAAPGKRIAITVTPGHWGKADLPDIQQLLEAVAVEFDAHVADRPAPRLNLRVVPRGTSPRVLYERGPAGEYVVHLSARDERWFQYAYQFAHELCHIVSNFDHKEMNGDEAIADNQWFEESLCETASLFTLKQLARTWTATPPAAKWAAQAPIFAAYAEYLQSEPHRRLAATQSPARWYRENQAALRDNPYLREKNELAAAVLLPLFEQAPAHWQAIAYLNRQKTSAAKSFDAYLADWHAACPAAHREIVRQTMALFGFDPTGAVAEHAAPARLSLLRSGRPANPQP